MSSTNSASICAAALPMPLAPPVMTATLPLCSAGCWPASVGCRTSAPRVPAARAGDPLRDERRDDIGRRGIRSEIAMLGGGDGDDDDDDGDGDVTSTSGWAHVASRLQPYNGIGPNVIPASRALTVAHDLPANPATLCRRHIVTARFAVRREKSHECQNSHTSDDSKLVSMDSTCGERFSTKQWGREARSGCLAMLRYMHVRRMSCSLSRPAPPTRTFDAHSLRLQQARS
ncbi:hypothetical protein EXIGLDRAFT_278318 [Exidia glandulosa HHB12029]|uniref:Uncharacterized protein n=1 Tax=Exidia glandulosa HHB12029 TaxID=1314781 RepID=A0A165DKN0_EXIGL|nr:hypothetical protein EXIGLDRAFT_278318 [Exidia glandulosa HHB12029]